MTRSSAAPCTADPDYAKLDLTENVVVALGSWTTREECKDLKVKLTGATYRTYARACFESAGGTVTSCSTWRLLSYPNTWDTLADDVRAGTRWQLQMRSDGDEKAVFSLVR